MANRLAGQSSPYLLQHAHNPVDWWPWGEEAFAEARRRNVPIFLSIGYSTCYWCHVMERESFEDPATAALLNANFLPIKVDREERPDVDDLYMTATMLMTGRGGWPMSAFLEPAALRPFYCGTYYPREPAHGMATFTAVLSAMADAWRAQRDGVLLQAAEVASGVQEYLARPPRSAPLGQAPVTDAVSSLLRMFDRTQGGFGAAPKFPQAPLLTFLLDVRERAADDSTADAIDAALRATLDRMAIGGLHDQIGGGFHRYCVDATWTVPHFEKMLYDQAQLLSVYARASARYADPYYAQVARGTAEFVLREMTTPEGLFTSALDAEVDHREGLNYLWTPQEVTAAALGDDEDTAMLAFGLRGPPNFRDPHHPGEPPRWVLRLTDRPERLALQLAMAPALLAERLDRARQTLLAARALRRQPHHDDKALACWNGLMIAALAEAGTLLDEPRYLAAAQRAAAALRDLLRTPDGHLARSWRHGRTSAHAVLEDYAAVIAAFAALGRSDPAWTRAAQDLCRAATARFADAGGVLFDAPEHSPDLFVRGRSTHDGAVPSGTSLFLHALLDLGELTGEAAYTRAALRALDAVSEPLTEGPVGCVNSARALLRLLLSAEIEPGSPDHTPPAPAQDGPALHAAAPEVVEVLAETDRISVPREGVATVNLALRIADGWHIPAAQPGDSPAARALIPLRVGVTGGTGVAAYADYPAGEPFGTSDARILVHRGLVPFAVVLERVGDWSGTPILTLHYQACSDRECQQPASVELDIALDPG